VRRMAKIKSPGAGERRLGQPRSNTERIIRHYGKTEYLNRGCDKRPERCPLPPRGTGLPK